MGFTVQTLQNYKALTEMIPELEDLVDTGIVTNTTALSLIRPILINHFSFENDLFSKKFNFFNFRVISTSLIRIICVSINTK